MKYLSNIGWTVVLTSTSCQGHPTWDKCHVTLTPTFFLDVYSRRHIEDSVWNNFSL